MADGHQNGTVTEAAEVPAEAPAPGYDPVYDPNNIPAYLAKIGALTVRAEMLTSQLQGALHELARRDAAVDQLAVQLKRKPIHLRKAWERALSDVDALRAGRAPAAKEPL